MVIKEYGNPQGKILLLLHPMLADGKTMTSLIENSIEKYRIISPDLSGHGEDEGDFISAETEARTLLTYLKEKNIREIQLLFGASLGARIGLELLAEKSINFKHIVFEGAPFFKNMPVLKKLVVVVFLKKQRKVRKYPERAIEKMKDIYGIFGESMAKSLASMSKMSIKTSFPLAVLMSFRPMMRSCRKRFCLRSAAGTAIINNVRKLKKVTRRCTFGSMRDMDIVNILQDSRISISPNWICYEQYPCEQQKKLKKIKVSHN